MKFIIITVKIQTLFTKLLNKLRDYVTKGNKNVMFELFTDVSGSDSLFGTLTDVIAP